jgi:hypothetical protein
MNRMGPREVLRRLAERLQGLAETWDLWEPGTRAAELSIFQERLRVLEKKEVAKALEGEP